MDKQPDGPPSYGFVVPPQPSTPFIPRPIDIPPTNQTVHVVQQPAIGPTSQSLQCPACNAVISTKIVTESTAKTHAFALLLCIIGLWPCICIPYCFDTCKNINHYCPSCDTYLGTFKHLDFGM